MRRSSLRSRRKPTRESNMASINADLFWAVGNFKRTVKRIDDGATICDDIVRMVTERAEIEAKYAKKMTAWEEKWKKQVENSQMYATMKNALTGVISEAQGRAKLHMDCYGKLHNQVIEKMKDWKNQTYHKHFMGYWKETREVDDEFTRAQKPWAEGFAKVQRAKRNYHSACKSFEAASEALSSAKKDENFAPDKVKKFEDSANKQENNVARTKKKYKEKLQRLEPINASYEVEMIKVFDKCQQMEEKKLNFFQDMMIEYHKSLNISEDTRLGEIFRAQIESAYSGNVKHDLTWWSENYGADMPRNWPKFEDFKFGENNFLHRGKQRKRLSIWTHLKSPRLSPCDNLSVATINMNLLDAELAKISHFELQALSMKETCEANVFEVNPSVIAPAQPSNDSIDNKEQSYEMYNNFYSETEMLLDIENAEILFSDTEKNNEKNPISKAVRVIERENAFGIIPRQDSLLLEATRVCRVVDEDSIIDMTSCGKSFDMNDHMCSASVVEPNLFSDKENFSCIKSNNVITNSQCSDRMIRTTNLEQPQNIAMVEPGTSNEIPENNFHQNNIQNEPEYQIPKRQESTPPPITPYIGGDNPFFSNDQTENRSDDEWEDPPPDELSVGVPVRALYTYNAVEDDELSFKSGDILTKLSEEDAQGWCKGRLNGREGLYPANYVELI